MNGDALCYLNVTRNVLLRSFLYQGQGISCTCIGTLNSNGTIIDVLCALVQGLSNRQVQFTMALYGKMGFYDGSRRGAHLCVWVGRLAGVWTDLTAYVHRRCQRIIIKQPRRRPLFVTRQIHKKKSLQRLYSCQLVCNS